MTRKKKKILILTAIITPVVLLLAFLLFFGTRTSQTDITIDRTSGCLGEMAILSSLSSNQFVNIRPELRFKLDTGADMSTITEHDLHVLDSLGFKIEKKFYPVLGRDGAGNLKFETVRYSVSLPLYKWKVTTDTLGNRKFECQYTSLNVLHNVDFAPSRTGFSVIGIDLLEKFKVEFRNTDKLIALHFDQPAGYENATEMVTTPTLINWLTLGHRYNLDLTVDNRTNRYFFDTGLQRVFVKRPKNEVPSIGKNLRKEKVRSFRGEFDAVADPKGWLEIGNREGDAIIHYYDNDEEDYAFNPINMFDALNVLVDFPNRQLMFSK